MRGPEGQSTIILPDTATIGELLAQLSKATSIYQKLDIKYGYPPKPLRIDEFETSSTLSDAGIFIDGEQLIVSEAFTASTKSSSDAISTTGKGLPEAADNGKLSLKGFLFSGVDKSPLNSTNDKPHSTPTTPVKPLTLSRKIPDLEPPELALQSHASTLTLRVMPDDNSCLFRAFGSAFFGAMDNMTELRSIIAQHIQVNPEKYPAVVLEKNPDDYCRWIQTEDAWGGAIELDILSRHFDVEICSIDVQTLRVDRFNEGRPDRCILVYSGIHYDTIAVSPADPPYDHTFAPMEFDTKIFDATDELVLERALDLCKILQERHYFTDTRKFIVRCNICQKSFTGEIGATEHAKETGHYDFGEAS